jgi:hypothetical protein
LGKKYRPFSSSLCNFQHFSVISSLLGPNILFSTLFSNTLSLRSSFNVSDQVSRPYRTTGNMRSYLIIKNAYVKRLLLERVHVSIRRTPSSLCPDAYQPAVDVTLIYVCPLFTDHFPHVHRYCDIALNDLRIYRSAQFVTVTCMGFKLRCFQCGDVTIVRKRRGPITDCQTVCSQWKHPKLEILPGGSGYQSATRHRPNSVV